MTPQVKTVLKHLQKQGSITQVEANAVHRIRALPRRISDLKEHGYQIKKEMKTDLTGQRYARYSLIPEPKVGDRVKVIDKDLPEEGREGKVMSVDTYDEAESDYWVLLDDETENLIFYKEELEVINV